MTAIKTLVIGAREGNILMDWVFLHSQGPSCKTDVRFPSKEELDVQVADSMTKYVYKNGPFDELVYGAAVNWLEWIPDIIRSNFIHEAFAVNVVGFIEMVSYHELVWPGHLKRIVGITSDAARTPMRGSLVYGTTKAAMSAAIKNMARELAPGCVVVGVAPGMVEDTPMTHKIDAMIPGHRNWTPEHASEYERGARPMLRRITKREVTETIHFALRGPDMLSGSIIEITGGR